jgi:hypothetical protein
MSIAVLAAVPAAGGPSAASIEKEYSHAPWEEEVVIQHGAAEQTKKGEDFWIAKSDVERAPGHTVSVYGVSATYLGPQLRQQCHIRVDLGL